MQPMRLPPSPNPLAARYGYDIETPQTAPPSLSHDVRIVRRNLWNILSFVAVCVTAALVVSARMAPIYESTVTIDVDRQMPTGILGQEAARPAVNDADQFLATQVKLIQSDSVLRPVAQQYRMPGAWEDVPVRLENLRITRPPNTYLLLISYRSPGARLSADVANAVARSYLEQTYDLRVRSSASLAAFMENQLDELKGKMERSSAALASFERELNVINPEEKTGILSARLLQLNTEYTNAQIDRVRKEGAWQSVRSGTLEAAQVSTQGEAVQKLAERLDEVRQRFAEVKTHYGANHPEFRKASAQLEEVESQLRQARENASRRVEVEYRESLGREATLRGAVAEAKTEFDRLNTRSFEYQALRRDAEADKKLYEDLVRKIKEAGINSAFENSAIRIADPARPSGKPVFPDTKLNAALALLFSTLVAIAAATVRERLDKTVRDPRQIAAEFQTEVVGSLPVVKLWRKRLPRALATGAAAGAFEDAVRTLRNSILLGVPGRPLKSVMITSASAAEGKTTVAVHVAIAHARRQRKTLLIDGDLRRPTVSGRLGVAAETGLATTLRNGFYWRKELVQLAEIPDLDILPAGPSDVQAADLIGGRLPQILREAGEGYDLIVIDAPPVLGFPEPLEMATAVDGVVVVAKAGATSRTAVGSALDTLGRVRANVLGIALNQAAD